MEETHEKGGRTLKAFVYEKRPGSKKVAVIHKVECVIDDKDNILIIYDCGKLASFDRKTHKATVYQN